MYSDLTESDPERSPYRPQELFWHGTGVTGEGMYQYMETLLGAFRKAVDPSEEVNALFGFWNPASGQVTLVPGNFAGILGAFDHARKVARAAIPPGAMPAL